MTAGIMLPLGAPPNELGARVAAYLHNAGFSGNALIVAVAIAKAESGWRYDAKGGPNSNGTFDWGLMQINDVHKPSQQQKTSPIANAKMAHSIYTRAGSTFKPWATFTSGAYRSHMAEATKAVTDLKAKGSAWERATIRMQPDGDSPGVDSKSGQTSGLNLDVPNPLAGIGSAFSSLNAQLGKMAGNAMSITIAVVLLVLGIVILMRGALPIGAAASLLKGATESQTATRPKPRDTFEIVKNRPVT